MYATCPLSNPFTMKFQFDGSSDELTTLAKIMNQQLDTDAQTVLKEVADLKAENTSLKTEVDSLKVDAANSVSADTAANIHQEAEVATSAANPVTPVTPVQPTQPATITTDAPVVAGPTPAPAPVVVQTA